MAGGRLWGAAARAVVVGGVLGAVWALAAAPVSDGLCHSSGDGADYGCLGVGLIFRPAGAIVGGLLGWVLLALVRVPRATRTAAAGFGVCVMLIWVQDYIGPFLRLSGQLTGDALILAAGYGLAHLLVAAETRPQVRVGVGIALLAVWPLSAMAQASTASGAEHRLLDTVSVPLLAPDVPGYRALYPMPTGVQNHSFEYLLLAKDTASDADDRDRHGLWVTVDPRPAGFAPPQRCDAEQGSALSHLSPCTPVAADVWRVQRDGRRWYIVQPPGRDDVVVMATDGPAVPENDVLAMAADLRLRTADFFGDGH
ncbi:hypothetical protein [Streptomyces sp. NPDC021020]|uniref:hypothetical protein n=1 Tax=Streptomyces sp. NPDC021020 TaxID=3365109 RepID=UPI003789724C